MGVPVVTKRLPRRYPAPPGTSARSPTCSGWCPRAIPVSTRWCCRAARDRTLPDPGGQYRATIGRSCWTKRRYPPTWPVKGFSLCRTGLSAPGFSSPSSSWWRRPGRIYRTFAARVYHKHRGVEVRFQGLLPADGVLLAERVEGVASVAHAMAFSQAIESLGAGEVAVPPGAMLVRAVHAELERVANHLDSTTRHTEAAGQAVAYARLTWHKERVMRLRAELCGSRFGRGVVVPGGVAGPPDVGPCRSPQPAGHHRS